MKLWRKFYGKERGLKKDKNPKTVIEQKVKK